MKLNDERAFFGKKPLYLHVRWYRSQGQLQRALYFILTKQFGRLRRVRTLSGRGENRMANRWLQYFPCTATPERAIQCYTQPHPVPIEYELVVRYGGSDGKGFL